VIETAAEAFDRQLFYLAAAFEIDPVVFNQT
jgi:hypothetical protein